MECQELHPAGISRAVFEGFSNPGMNVTVNKHHFIQAVNRYFGFAENVQYWMSFAGEYKLCESCKCTSAACNWCVVTSQPCFDFLLLCDIAAFTERVVRIGLRKCNCMYTWQIVEIVVLEMWFSPFVNRTGTGHLFDSFCRTWILRRCNVFRGHYHTHHVIDVLIVSSTFLSWLFTMNVGLRGIHCCLA